MLSADEIRELIAQGVIINAKDDAVQPTSLDVHISQHPPKVQAGCWTGYQSVTDLTALELDEACEMEELSWRTDANGRHIIMPPGAAWLVATEERVVLPNNITPRVTGCSTIGRKFLIVHATSDHIDAGFPGQITLELVNLGHRPIILRPGARIGQLVFTRHKPTEQYSGRYVGQMGPTAPRSKDL